MRSAANRAWLGALAAGAGLALLGRAVPPPGTADSRGAAPFPSETQKIPGTDLVIALVRFPEGKFMMGGAAADERPAHQIKVSAFWIGRYEITWDQYDAWAEDETAARRFRSDAATGQAHAADAVSRPTPPYAPMDKGMGRRGGYPAVCMTHFAARQFTRWLTLKTGRFHRLPSEAEWEYACRAGTTTPYSFGHDRDRLGDHAWYHDNADDRYHRVGGKRANPWGLYDMHGNVAEWVLDRYDPGTYARPGRRANPLARPAQRYPRVVRGGSWMDDAPDLRSAARGRSDPSWNQSDGTLPRSIWTERDAPWVGFRVVRPVDPPPPEQWSRYWEPDHEVERAVYRQQRRERGLPEVD